MSIDEGPQALAAEYVLGTLDPDECVQAEAKISSDPTFARMVASWQERLAPLLVATAPAAPSAQLKYKLMARLDAMPDSGSSSNESQRASIAVLRRQVRRWRIAT